MRLLVIGAAIDRAECGLFTGLKAAGVDVQIVCEASSPHAAELRAAGISVEHRTISSKLDLRSARWIRARLAAAPCDVVYALTARALTTALWATRGTNQRIITYRGTVGHLSRLDPSSYLGFLNTRISKISCVSRAVEEYLRSKGVPASRLKTIYKGHDAAWYAGGQTVALGEFGIPPGVPVAACTANMRPVKGVDVLVSAFAAIKDRTPAHLLLIGEVRDDAVRRRVTAGGIADRVHFTGFRRDAPQIVRSCSCFVMPSRAREGLPKAVIEAMAQGVPPIVTAVGGMPELVIDGISGLVVPPSDAEALGEAILLVLGDSDRAARFGAAASERIRGEFSVGNTVQRTLELLAEV